MRPSKLRLPESTATTLRSCCFTSASISGGAKGPEFPMQRSEGSICCLGKVAVLHGAFECRAVSEYRWLFLLEFPRGNLTCGPERESWPLPVQLTDPCGHPKPLPVNRVDRPPVDGRCARAQGFVDAVPEADLPHERESVGQLETNFNAWLAIFRFGVRGLRAPDRVLPDDRPVRADRAPLEKTQHLTNHFLLCRDVLGLDGVRIAGLRERRTCP